MTVANYDVAIVGAGAAGLSAATEAVTSGARVVLIDDNSQPGGQYFRQLPQTFETATSAAQNKAKRQFSALRKVLDSPLLSYRPNATVWDFVDPLTLAIADAERSGRVMAKSIIIATGARDNVVAFPGWTLPGVMTAGGLQNLIKGMHIAPPGPVVVAGNGPLLLVAAASLVNAGVQVAAVVEAANQSWRISLDIVNLALAPSILKLAAQYRLALLKAGTPILRGHTVVAAHGDPDLHGVEIAAIDADGNINRRKSLHYDVQTLITGFGLTPSLELARLLGAQEAFLPLRGGSTIVRSETLMTNVAGVFAAGDGAAIGGAALSLVEGRIAGINACLHAGIISKKIAQTRLSKNLGTFRRLCQFRAGLERFFKTPAKWQQLLTSDTIICRCEDITLGQLEQAIAGDNTSSFQLKAATRIGMGRCQGRNCLASLAKIITGQQTLSSNEVAMP
ncbi:MAG: NADPH-dependent 2,4-dienoyl-CoA reductase/sulfur reductase-like enzyme, partial [Gammaproteobacteria bacterium]